jgi:hypothetical protein
MTRRMLFTLNNPTNEEFMYLRDELPQNPIFRYLVVQGEFGAKNKTPHLQGYVEITKNQRLSFFKKYVSNRAHFEVASGTSKQNAHYCMKPVDNCLCRHCIKAREGPPNWLPPLVIGEPATDVSGAGWWEAIAENVKDGRSNLEIMEEFPRVLAHFRTMNMLRRELREQEVRNKTIERPYMDFRPMRVVWLYGSSDSGKSYSVWSSFPNLYPASSGSHPFDLYQGQQVVLWDDFKKIDIEFLLKYLDVYPVQLDCRYNNKWAAWNDVYITSNFHPLDLYEDLDMEHMGALYRRIEVVKVERTETGSKFLRELECPLDECESDFDVFETKTYDSFFALVSDIPYRVAAKGGGSVLPPPPVHGATDH